MFEKLYSQTSLENSVAKVSLKDKPVNDAEDKKKAKEAAKIERELKKKMSSKVVITRIARNKRKSVTSVYGLQNFDIDLKKAAKSFASKFACGSSVVKNNQGNDEIVVQGDVSDDLFDYILETWPDVPEDNIELTEEKKSKKG
ncbi:4959_t:CDS:2 [Funneliformis caledonium]|uniref:Translation machinery-associated protein 22 n=1 Tax=Funneliformis caledonium TaxID=1117310 RepID=A0A9N9GLI2_9GLOM|nr:4959_t:CDS:2 [Funneliformis caledonium]